MYSSRMTVLTKKEDQRPNTGKRNRVCIKPSMLEQENEKFQREELWGERVWLREQEQNQNLSIR